MSTSVTVFWIIILVLAFFSAIIVTQALLFSFRQAPPDGNNPIPQKPDSH